MTASDTYTAVHEAAVIGDLQAGGFIGISGSDRASYLQGLLTNDIQALTAGTGCYAAWLTAQGRLITDLHVLESGDMILLDVPAEQTGATLQRLDQFLFSEDVQLVDLRPALSRVSVHGPLAASVIERTVAGLSDIAGWVEHRNARAEFAAAPIVVARVDRLGVAGYSIYIEPAAREALVAALHDAGAVDGSADVLNVIRVEQGVPLFGIDMDEETIPLEADIESRAISFTKGCYVGQEVIIRVLHRGHGRVAKKLVGLQLTASTAVAVAGARVLAGEREIGRLTSTASSPRLGAIALGYVHRDFAEPGTGVTVDVAGDLVAARVSTRPFPSAA